MSEDGSATSFSPEQERALSSVLDEIIPRSEDGRLPGAGELGLVDYVARKARAIQPLIIQGVGALDELARSRGAPDFAALDRCLTPVWAPIQRPAAMPLASHLCSAGHAFARGHSGADLGSTPPPIQPGPIGRRR